MQLRPVILIAVGSIALSSCGSDGDDASSVASDSLPAASDGEGGSADQVQVEITIADFAFAGDQEVPVGGRVVVTNDDGAAHTWTAVDGSFDSGTLASGESFEFTFDEPGTYEYRCDIHPSMIGTITVTG